MLYHSEVGRLSRVVGCVLVLFGSLACGSRDDLPASAPLTRAKDSGAGIDDSRDAGEDPPPKPDPLPGAPLHPGAEVDAGVDTDAGGVVRRRWDGTIARCDSEAPNPFGIAPPSADTEVDDIRFELGSDTPRAVQGTVIEVDLVETPRAVARAVLVASGGFLDDGCLITQDGASFSWQGVACTAESGQLFNVLVVEPGELSGIAAAVRPGLSLRMSGYEIARYNDFSPGGGWYEDGGDDGDKGQVSLWLTQLCER